jgi:ABC-type multidrug transport system ATPase subunit
MLTVRNVTKKYGKFTALRNIDLEFTRGVYALLAPNGAGKTTLIKMLTTLIFPTEGTILWKGEDIVSLDEKYREIVGFLPQEFGYYKGYSPREYLRYLAALNGVPRPDAQIDELLGLVSLSDVKDKKMRKFSGGMIRRVGVAQALLGDPRILILDEPTAGLDPKERVRFRNLIAEYGQDRIVILSTHIVSDIESIADEVIMFKDRELLCAAPPGEIKGALAGKIPDGGGLEDAFMYFYGDDEETSRDAHSCA